MTTSRQFLLELGEFADEVEATVQQIVKKLSLEALQRVVLRSPVDTVSASICASSKTLMSAVPTVNRTTSEPGRTAGQRWLRSPFSASGTVTRSA